MTKVDIFSGFLGAGKTTLLKKLIQEAYAGEKLVLIENEFGEIGIDGGFMQEAGIDVTEMNSGCICCSLVGDFGKALQEVLDTYKPDRILIEPSGVGKLSDVMEAVRKLEAPDLLLNACVTVTDANKCKLYMKNFGEFYNNQVEYAGTIVLSRTEQLDEKKLANTVALLREKNSVAPIITTPWAELSGVQILEAMEGSATLAKELENLVKNVHAHDCSCGPHHEHEHEEHDCSCGHHHEHEHEEHDCSCGHHHEHEHEEHDCSCGHHHEHEHEEHDCSCEHHHEHEHEEHDCSCGNHHEHEHEGHDCSCGHHHEHEHEGHDCSCGHHHEHEHEEHDCSCGHHHEHEHGEACSCGHEHHHDADEVFQSWGIETTKRFSREKLATALEELANERICGLVLRAKGIVPSEDGTWLHFDYVPGEVSLREGSAGITGRLCVIGAELHEEAIASLFVKQ